MSVLNTKYKRKSAAITAIILLFLIFIFFNVGMHYLDPPEEYGVSINFGDSTMGIGSSVAATKKSEINEVVDNAEDAAVQKEIAKDILEEDVILSNVLEAPELPIKVQEKQIVLKKEVAKEELKAIVSIPQPSKENQEALNKLLSSTKYKDKVQSEGSEVAEGTKGVLTGDLKSAKYYGNVSSGVNQDYNLTGRKALLMPKKQPNCQEEGIVVVRISVDNKGRVVRAVPGVKGTTNTALCLSNPAKEAALLTIWNVDIEAPEIQTGTIIYKFSLSK
jgi:outer membrane biosynthesis protein TonB